MNTIKTVFLAALLSAAAYGVYVGVTGAPPNFGHRRKAHDWEETAADGAADDGQSEVPSAPLVSVDEGPPLVGGMISPQMGSGLPETNAAPPAATGALEGQPPVTGESTPAQYISHQRYPASRPDVDPRSLSATPAGADPLSPAEHAPVAEMSGRETPAGYDEVPPRQAADTRGDVAALMQSVDGLLAQNRLADAHLELSEWFGYEHFTPEEDAHVTNLLDRLAGTVIYSRQHLLERPYEVPPGDTLDKIADAYEVSWELLANINGIRDPRAVRPGDQLKVVKGPFNAYVNVPKLQLVLYLGNRYAGRFPIGAGKDHEMPEGMYAVVGKITNPIYYGRPVIDKDDPNNPLGEYAIDLGNGILIHGTNDPQGIARADSRGCIRLANRDIKDIFDILTPKSDRTAGSLVQIKRY